MDEIFRDFLVTLIIVSAIFGIIYTYYITRHRERMTMMDKGIDLLELSSRTTKHWATLKYGMLLVGFAIGILMGNILSTKYELENVVSYSSMTFLSGGISLIIHFLIEKKFRE